MYESEGRTILVRAPATSANLGPGFDCMGMVLDLWNQTRVSAGEDSVQISGEGAESLPVDARNLLVSSARKTFEHLAIPTIPMSFRCANAIPCARGLGSSSAAIVTGIAAAYAMAGIDPASDEVRGDIFNLAASIEGHPDNVAPAIFGGCQIGIQVRSSNGIDSWQSHSIDIQPQLKAVIFVPDFSMHTAEARGILPTQVKRSDAIFNIGRAALLTLSLATGNWEMLRHAADDRLHQPIRVKRLFPRFTPIANAAIQSGAHGVFLSGAGPAVIALASQRYMTICYEMAEAARKTQTDGKAMILNVGGSGIDISIED